MIIRKIQQADIPALFEVRTQTGENQMSLEELENIGVTEETISFAIEESHCGWLCEFDDRVVGFAMGDFAEREMTVIALLPEYEKRGIGGKLLTKVEQWLKEKGCTEIWLTTDIDKNLRAHGFYIKQGWEDWKIENDLQFMIKYL